MTGLERSYRRLLRLYPRDYRAGREEEMVGVLLDTAAPGQQRPTAADVADLGLGAARVRALEATQLARRRPGHAAGWAALVVGLAVALVPWAPSPGARLAASLPPTIAGYSYLTGSASSSPPGPALALYQQGWGVEFMDFPQAVVVGASGAHRRLDLAERRAGPETQGDPTAMLLSGDGTRVAVGQYVTETPDVAVQDLVTGAVRRVDVGEGSGVIPLAWAPDGSSLVALVSAAPLLPYVGLRGPDLAGRPVLVDVETGAARPLDLPGAPSVVRAAAFSPDGRHLALQPGPREVVLVDLAGGPPRSLDAPDGLLAGSAAWSPDGRLLAVDAARCTELLPVDGSEASTCLTEAGQGHHRFVGWAGARSAVVLVGVLPDGRETDPAPLVAVDLDTRERSTLSGIRTAGANYAVSRLQVPAAALSGALLSVDGARDDPARQPTGARGRGGSRCRRPCSSRRWSAGSPGRPLPTCAVGASGDGRWHLAPSR